MLGGVRLKLCSFHERTCFGYMNPKYSNNGEQSQCIQLLYKNKRVYLWLSFNASMSEGLIGINPIYLRLLGLDEGGEVFVSPHTEVKVLDELYVDTDSPDDQELLEHNAELLQLRILDQLRLVVANQKAIIWISISLPIVFTPKQSGLLINHSRIVVEVDVFNTLHKRPKSNQIKDKALETEFKTIGLINDALLKPYLNPPQRLVLRVALLDTDEKKSQTHPYKVYIHEDLIDSSYKQSKVILASMESIPSVLIENKDSEGTASSSYNVCVEIIPIDCVIYKSLSHELYNRNIPTILLPKTLSAVLNAQNGEKVILTMIQDNLEKPDEIEIICYADELKNVSEIVEKFKSYVIESTHSGKTFLINCDLVQPNMFSAHSFLKFNLKPDRLKYAMLNLESFRHSTVSCKFLKEAELSRKPTVSVDLDYVDKRYCRTMKSVENLVSKVIEHLTFELHREANFKGVSEIKSNVLVTGLSGTGKSSLCQIVQHELTVWSHILNCRSLKGRKDIPEALGKAILMCQERSPAVLICDDVDALVPPSMEGGSPQDIAYYQRLAVVIKHLLQTCAGVAVLMTATSINNLHPTLKQFNGKPMFTAHFDVKELLQEERFNLLNHLINDKIRSELTVEEDDVIKLSMNTGGQNVREIIDTLNKIIFKAVKKKTKTKDTKPRLLDETGSSKESNKTLDVWEPIGGLHSVKQELTECIFWPLMYPALFPSQSCGILLYGPPGTGKSFIGSCLAAHAQLNFIAVKGPELLSKYIGQSEKAVRDIFDKADMKRPCVLFFDEFDSLAPKRGHDSTGVTDRVVNQLLARLDGAEGGSKGPVIAGTSRPDLIDPALLRAGRLQRHVYCGPPDENDRHEILSKMSCDVTLSDSVDLREMALKTEGFTPADLKSLLVTAQLTSLDKQLGSKLDEQNMESVVVTQEDLDSALLETKPSLSKEQMRFYDMIYKRFRGETLLPEEKIMSSQFQKQRVTLA